jgi:hypothetical protein
MKMMSYLIVVVGLLSSCALLAASDINYNLLAQPVSARDYWRERFYELEKQRMQNEQARYLQQR